MAAPTNSAKPTRRRAPFKKENSSVTAKRISFICACIIAGGFVIPLGISYGQTQAGDVVLYASQAPIKVGTWQVVSDETAAGGSRIASANLGIPKIPSALPNPVNYFEMSFYAQTGTAYRLWVRSKAENDAYYNDSIYAQFSGSVDGSGSSVYRIGTTSATTIVLEDCNGCGSSQWGWQDNGWGSGVMGPLIYFQSTGTQTIRVQTREDGLSIDQIVLSPQTYLNSSPGVLKNDSTILPITNGNPSPTPTPTPAYSVTTSPSAANSGQALTVTWTAPNGRPANDWIGLYKVGEAETSYISWQYTGGAPSGSTSFTGPSQTGQYEFRYFTNNSYSRAATSNPVTVSGVAAYSLAASPSPVNAGQPLNVIWTAPGGRPANDWNGLYRVGDPNTSYISWQYTGGAPSGSMTFTAPSQGGQYEFRYFTNNSYNKVATSNPVTVAFSPPVNQPPQVSVTTSQTSGTGPLNVEFTPIASDPDGYITSYSWSFGDGQTSSQAATSHLYQTTGTFTASLTVTDNAGVSATSSVGITVNSPPTNGTSLKVMSFNIEFGEGTDGIYNLDRTATWIANINPDIVALCQVNRYAYDDQAVRLTTLMGQKTGRTWYFHWKEKYPGDYEGQMILSKYPFVSTSSLYLSYQMSVAQGTINVGGRNVNFFSAHLDWIYPSWREVQAAELNTWAATFAEPRIIAGDFNAWPDQTSIATMNVHNHDAWAQAVNNGTSTAYPDNPVGSGTRTRKGRIDYVFYSRGATPYLEITGAQVPDSRDLSNPNVVRRIGTLDDRGVRPSEHNSVIATFLVR
jgi:endonuclease/exonuclease/phosphatase family metal-dependent hydrolase